MKIQDWRGFVVEELRDHIGPLAPVLVDQVIREADINPHTPTAEEIAFFLKRLRPELPSCIDRSGFVLGINKSLLLSQASEGSAS